MNAIPGYYKAERDYHSLSHTRTDPDQITALLRKADEVLDGVCEGYKYGNFEDADSILTVALELQGTIHQLKSLADQIQDLEEDL